ncbi:MAG: hypothetical protein KF790_06545, partial [Steroidobacteraceae bacterium]|nr:hypothetical protein [Steroidobacteraceae bacterium]
MFPRLLPTVNQIAACKSTIGRWLTGLERLCMPPTCALCGAAGRVDRAGRALDLCIDCDRELPACRGPLERRPTTGAAPWSLVVAPYRYDYPVDHCVRALKFHGDAASGRLLGMLIARERAAHAVPLPDVVVPVPLHRVRYLERGFNQAAVIGGHAARSLGLPLAAGALERR